MFPVIQPLLLCAAPQRMCPAMTLAAVHSVTEDDPVLLALPADLAVGRVETFPRALTAGAALAHQGYVVAFGLAAEVQDPGFGQMRAGSRVPGRREAPASYIESFAEHADAQLVRIYPQSDRLLWHSGVLMARASVWIEAVACLRKDLLALCQRAYLGTREGEAWRVAGACGAWPDCALLEGIAAVGSPAGPSPEAVVVALEAGAEAVPPWKALHAARSLPLAPRCLVAQVDDEDLVMAETAGGTPALLPEPA